MELHNALEQVGLSRKQAAVYLATLELGQAPVGQIAYKASIKRPTTYVILEELQNRGLIETIPRDKSTHYIAANPAIIRKRLSRQAALMDEALPELQALQNNSETKPKVRFYEGKESIYNLYESEIFRQKDIFSLVNIREFAKIYSEAEMKTLLDRMRLSNLNAKELVDDSKAGRWYVGEKGDRKLGNTKVLPKKLKFDVDFLVYGNTVATVSLKNQVAVVIEDSAISKAQLQLLNFLYDSIE